MPPFATTSLSTSCSHPCVTWKLMNPMPATSEDDTKSAGGRFLVMAAATSAGLRLISEPHTSARFVEKSPNRFWGGRVRSN